MANAETTPKTFDVGAYVRRTPNGSIDVQGSHLAFTQDVAALVSREKTDGEIIAQAVEKAFRDRNVSQLGMNAILHYTMENLEVEPHLFNNIRERVAQYVRSNTRAFKISKGKGGGVQWLQGEAPVTGSVAPSSSSVRPRQHA